MLLLFLFFFQSLDFNDYTCSICGLLDSLPAKIILLLFFFWAWLVVQHYRLKYAWSLAKICSSHRPKDNAYFLLWFVKCRVIHVFLCFWFIILRHEKLNCLSNVFVYPTSILFFFFLSNLTCSDYFLSFFLSVGTWSFSNLWRATSEEKRALERLEHPMYNSVRQAAEVHRQVANRSYV